MWDCRHFNLVTSIAFKFFLLLLAADSCWTWLRASYNHQRAVPRITFTPALLFRPSSTFVAEFPTLPRKLRLFRVEYCFSTPLHEPLRQNYIRLRLFCQCHLGVECK